MYAIYIFILILYILCLISNNRANVFDVLQTPTLNYYCLFSIAEDGPEQNDECSERESVVSRVDIRSYWDAA